ncbi:DNA polymerase IV [Agaribacillus aureus]|uniref:DNA polymerase IV n=1 Tax=Agaribacillus aureus TaxID=3051825 RepID=UPI003D1B2A5D
MINNEDRSIIHMDLDSFFVSVECLIDSRLKGKPLLIGGNGGRGVVASCSYETRKFGVHSAMPMSLAKQLCPDAIIISGDMEAYTKYSHMVTEIISDSAPLFEKSSIDEFYIDVSGMDRFFGCFRWAKELRQKIMKNTGLPLSMGLSTNKMVSKVATGEAKPSGEKQVMKGMETEFLDPMPIRKIPLLGNKTAGFLNDMGIRTVKILREMPVDMLVSIFGKNGRLLWNRAHGIDHSPVVPHTERKSISSEITFDADTINVQKLKALFVAMIEKLAFKLRKEKQLTSCITIKIRYSDFETVTRQKHIPYTSCDHTLIKLAEALFDRLYDKRLLIRLIGVRLSHLVHGYYQIDLFDDTEEWVKLYQAMDHIKHKYGQEKLIRANTLGVSRRVRMDNNVFMG